MSKRWPGALALLLGGAATMLCAGGVRAQSDSQVTGSAQLGWRSFFERPSALEMAKFEEYRDMSPGPYLESFRLQVLPGEKGLSSFELGSTDAFRRDQSFWLHGAHTGLFDLRLGWDQIPHTYSTDARNWGGSLTNFSLPVPRPDTNAWKSLSNAPYLDAVRNEWKVGRAALALTPGEFSDLKLEYTRIDKNGQRPMGMAFGSPGANQREILEPVDQTVNDLRLSQSYARQKYQFQFSYDLNQFSNRDASVSADNPLVGTNTAAAGAATGRTALAPSNVAQTLSFGGGVSLPARTRINTALSYSWRRQNEAFLPMTVNSAITDARQTTMPHSLNGDVRTLLANVTASSRITRDVNLSARYRYWDYSDRTPEITSAQMPIEIVNDRSVSVITDPTVNEPMPYKRQNAGVDLGWHRLDAVNLKAGIAWERWDREAVPGPRNVASNNEYTPRLTLDVTPMEWLLLRGSISHSRRRGSTYVDSTERADFRRFDEADRDANRGDLLLQLTPNDRVSVGLNYARGKEDFPAETGNPNPLGVRADDNTTIGADLGWTPLPRLNLFGSYTREVYNLQQHSRYGEPSLPNDLTYDWIADSREWVETYGGGATATLIKKRLDLEFRYDRSNGISALHSRNPQTPTGGTASQNANATAVNFPDITHSWNPIRLSLRYQVNPDWAGTLGYNYESFQNNDFRTNGVLPPFWGGRSTVDAVGDVILGNDLLPYTASFLTFTISFRPGAHRTQLPILSVAQ